jgi:hypothetical protein
MANSKRWWCAATASHLLSLSSLLPVTSSPVHRVKEIALTVTRSTDVDDAFSPAMLVCLYCCTCPALQPTATRTKPCQNFLRL